MIIRSIILGVCGLGLTFAVHAGEDVSKSSPAAATGHVQVTNTSGDITVTGWDRMEVEVTAELADGADLALERDGDHTIVKVFKAGSKKRMGSSDLTIMIPQDSELTVTGVSSDIEVRNVRGVQRLEAVSGEINADVFGGDIEVKTVSGDVQIDGHGGASLVTVTSLSGDTEILDVAGEVESTTVSGDMKLRAGKISRARLKATNGDIDIVADLESGGRLESETISGDVEIELLRASDLKVDIETFNGDIENCFGILSQRKSEYGPGRQLRFSRGAGDRHVRVKTMNGEVEICSSEPR